MPKEAYTNQFIPGKQGTLMRGKTPTSTAISEQQQPQTLQQSFERMGIGKIGGLGGRMGELEKASMRLAEAASQRSMAETEKEYGLKGGLLEKEIAARTAGIGAQAKASRKAEIEMELNRLRSSFPSGYGQAEELKKRIAALQGELRSY